MNAFIVWTLSSGLNDNWGRSDSEDDSHRLADSAAHRQDDRCHDPRDSGRQDHLADDLELGGTHRVGAFAQAAWHGPHRVLRDRGDERRDEDPDDDATSQSRLERDPEQGLEDFRREEVDGKKPRTMVGIPAIVSSTGLTTLRTRFDEYSEQDRRQQPERDPDDHGDDRHEQPFRSPAQGHRTGRAGSRRTRPSRSGSRSG
jgi:hypothetical protein